MTEEIEKIARIKVKIDPGKVPLDYDVIHEAQQDIEILINDGLSTNRDIVAIVSGEFLGWES